VSEPPVEYIELNLCNHDEHDVSQLNEWGIWAVEEIERLESEVALREEAAERLAAINAELLAACKKAKQSSLCVEARNMIIAAIEKAQPKGE